jgi:hypothetical protein
MEDSEGSDSGTALHASLLKVLPVRQSTVHVYQGLAAQCVTAAGTTFRINKGRRGKWVYRGLAVGHKMWVCSMVLSNGKGSCGIEKVSERNR